MKKGYSTVYGHMYMLPSLGMSVATRALSVYHQKLIKKTELTDVRVVGHMVSLTNGLNGVRSLGILIGSDRPSIIVSNGLSIADVPVDTAVITTTITIIIITIITT